MSTSPLRSYIMNLSQDDLMALFDEMDTFERTSIVHEDALLRRIATQFMENNALSMLFVGYEVWRELAFRGME
jgi:hypothetical protein